MAERDLPPIPPLPADVEGVWGWAEALSARAHAVAKLKAERRAANRQAAQNRPDVKARKSAAMKAHHTKKLADAQADRDMAAYRDAHAMDEGCTCPTCPMPPCGWCESATEEDWLRVYGKVP